MPCRKRGGNPHRAGNGENFPPSNVISARARSIPQGARNMAKQLRVAVESLPSPPPAPGAVLNSPAQSNGSFVIGWARPFDGDDYRQVASHMWKYSRDDLEEFDMFEADPGWRIDADGLDIARSLGYEIFIDNKRVSFADGQPLLDTIAAHVD